MQKFVPRSHVRIFHNERTRSTPLDSKLMFCTIWMHLGPFGCLTKLRANGPKWCKSSCHEDVSEFFATNVPIHPIEPKTHVWYYFILFLCIWHRSVALQNSVRNRPNWCKSSCHEVASEFFATNATDPPHCTLNSCTVIFGCTRDHLVALQNSMQNGPKWCKSSCHEVVSEVFATNAPDPPYWTITSCFIAFRTIWVHLGQFVALQDSVQHWANLCKSSCHEVAS